MWACTCETKACWSAKSWQQMYFPPNLQKKTNKIEGKYRQVSTRNSENHTFLQKIGKKKFQHNKTEAIIWCGLDLAKPPPKNQIQNKTAQAKGWRRGVAFHTYEKDAKRGCRREGRQIGKLLAVWMGCDTMLFMHVQGTGCSLANDECKGRTWIHCVNRQEMVRMRHFVCVCSGELG